jgi:serine/threonine protein kinase
VQREEVFEGTPAFASPEQAAGQPLTPASDIFSLGSVMFKVLTGRTPFNGRNMREILDAVCTANPPFPRDVANGVPEDLQAITLACLSWDPLRRPTAEQLAVELGRYLAGEPVRLRPALYTDILRRRLTEYAQEVVKWRHQGMISQDEADRMETVHRRILRRRITGSSMPANHAGADGTLHGHMACRGRSGPARLAGPGANAAGPSLALSGRSHNELARHGPARGTAA